MAWMIFLAREKDLGNGCKTCRFRIGEECIADKRVDIHDNDDLKDNPTEINEYRPYHCPFRYFDKAITPITNRFHGMTEEETKGWFKGADREHKRYIRLEKERDKNVESWYRESQISGKTHAQQILRRRKESKDENHD